MKKNKYMTPAIMVVKLDMTAQILSVSVKGEGAASDIKWGGNGNGVEAGSREYDWDE